MTKIIFVLSVLIFALGLYVFTKNEDTLSFNNRTDNHIRIIITANELSSFVKRAEGHLLMYLLLKKPIDRDKFFQRMVSSKENVTYLIQILENETDKNLARALLLEHDQTLKSANKILQQFDLSLKTNNVFNFKSNQNIINTFHSLTSNIREKAVSMVSKSADNLRNEQIKIDNKIGFEKWLVIVTVVSCFALLLVIIFLSGKMKQISQKLHEYSYIDSLTGIANRRAFEEKFNIEWQRALREKSGMALMLIDIDSFKQVNDLHGHSAGDECLQRIAQTLQSCLKRPTDLIARYGGEEFAIILPNTTEAMMVAEQCRKSVNEMLCPIDSINNLSITIGVGIFTVTSELEKQQVIKQVDQALYRGKNSGKNRVELAVI